MLPFIILMHLVIWSIILHLATSQTLLLHRWTYNQTIFLLIYWSIFLINISTIERKQLHFLGCSRSNKSNIWKNYLWIIMKVTFIQFKIYHNGSYNLLNLRRYFPTWRKENMNFLNRIFGQSFKRRRCKRTKNSSKNIKNKLSFDRTLYNFNQMERNIAKWKWECQIKMNMSIFDIIDITIIYFS